MHFHLCGRSRHQFQALGIFVASARIFSYDCNGTEFVRDVASCFCYQAEYGWYGLMSPDGKIITGPMSSDITAVGPDLYLCKDDMGNGILLNSKGERVELE